MEVTHRQIQQERPNDPEEEPTEEEKQFLKELYSFMKRRDTPIERIPNLGFKQIHLYLMYTTVRDLGGYQQVTTQQLWKQVYNTLGGNPRSTSAATCTRRHYEKLLLPYECHVRGVSMNIPLHLHQTKHYQSANYSKDADDGLIPAKRKLLSVALHQQSMHPLQSNQHGSAFHQPFHMPHFYPQNYAVLPPHFPIAAPVLPPRSPPAHQPKFSFEPYSFNPTEGVKEPLEHLRYLAEQYKTTSGLSEPLNLSIRGPRQQTTSNPASSFSTPPSIKNPKFLNKPSPLYSQVASTEGRVGEVARSKRCEVQGGEATAGPSAFPARTRETEASSSPTYHSAFSLKTGDGTAEKPSTPPKTDFTLQAKERRVESSEMGGLNFHHLLPGLPRENERGEMEIEIPLSVFHKWLRLCKFSDAVPEHRQPPGLEKEHSGQRDCLDTDMLPKNLTFRINPPNRSELAEDLSLRSLPSSAPTTETSGNHRITGQNPFSIYKPLSSGVIPSSLDKYPFDQRDISKSYGTKYPNAWDAYDLNRQAQERNYSYPLAVQQSKEACKSSNEDVTPKESADPPPSAVLLLNSGSNALVHLTSQEVMKLKKIISSSS